MRKPKWIPEIGQKVWVAFSNNGGVPQIREVCIEGITPVGIETWIFGTKRLFHYRYIFHSSKEVAEDLLLNCVYYSKKESS